MACAFGLPSIVVLGSRKVEIYWCRLGSPASHQSKGSPSLSACSKTRAVCRMWLPPPTQKLHSFWAERL